MWQKLWHKINNTVTGGAFLIAFFSFLSKLFALFRERLIAHNFGASADSDVYYAAFRLPDLIFNTLVLGALTSAFIPVFQKVWHKNKEDGLVLANSVMNFFLIFIGVLVIFAYIFAPKIVPVFTPGFEDKQLLQAVVLTRVMLLAIVFFVASNVIGGILNSWKRFFSFSLAASFYNIGIIIGIVWFYPIFGLIGLAWGVFLGAVLHLLVQLPEAIKHGWHYSFSLKFEHNLRRILKLMLPRTIGLAAGQVNLIVITMIASTLSAGSIAVFNMANNLQSLPISLFAVSLAIAVFPTFTQAVNENNSKLFAENFSISLRRILFLVIPVSVLILVLREPIVRIILGTGAFNWENTKDTAQALGLFALSMFAQGLIPLLARSFYAHEDTKTPMSISIFSILLNIFLSWKLSQVMGVLGLALAFSISSIINMLLLYIILHLKVKNIDDNRIFKSLIMISINAISAGAICFAGMKLLEPMLNMYTFLGVLIQAIGAGLMGLLTYLILSILFRLEEVEIFRRVLKKFWLFFANGKH